MRRRWLWLLVPLLALVAVPVALARPMPEGQPGPEAEALADRMLAAVDADAWARTGALKWRSFGHEHVWDKAHGRARVRWGKHDVSFDTASPAPEARDAWAIWVNDSFWLNPVVKVRDPGTTRLRTADGDLLVRYASGGVTPGDAYLWRLGADGLPVAWRLWVHVIPVPGLRVTWERWVTLATGAKVATRHRFPGGFAISIEDVVGAESIEQLGGWPG